MELPNKYNFKEIEAKWKAYWEENNTYVSEFKTDDNEEVFSVDTPPPTVSGKIHMGHAFSYAQGDFIVRFKRMKGKKIFYPFGTDDNGLPTEHLIEKTKKVNPRSMTRPEFVKLCHETIKEIKPEFIQAWIDLGVSADYKNSYSTIDSEPTRVSQKSFLDLYEKGFVYKKETPTTWCVKCQTAIAQADFENIEKDSFFNDIAFHDDEGKELIIATTRPELLPACVGLFAHPDDKRYQYLKGKTAKVPLFNYDVPILFDKEVAMDKGTGLMMCCTFGDKEDVEKWHKHQLELRQVIEKFGKLNSLAGKYEGLKIIDARRAIIEDLKESGDLKNQVKISHNANAHDRCGTEIEFMKTSQWFVNVMDHKEKLIKAADEITWHPEHMKVRYVNWVSNLNWDWCISRQRHFGVPFPVWYEKDTGNIIVAKDEDLPIDPTTKTPKSYSGNPENLIPESDVLDTWATSSVTPQIALGWGKSDDETFKKNMPMTIRLQSHDIIRTWAFYTITKSLYNNGVVPWNNIMISGFVLDSNGKKMSKSKGNTIDPIALTDKYGADAVRYGASAVKLGEDLPFQEKYLETGKRTITKLFNAAKFAHMHLEDYNETFDITKIQSIDKWIISKLQKTIKSANDFLDAYEFSKARADVEKFFWQDLCDNYLEIVKDRLYKPEVHGDDARLSGQMTLAYVLETVVKLFAPYLPFVTEEIYSWYFSGKENSNAKDKTQSAVSIHTSSWPTFDEKLIFENEELAGEKTKYILSAGRKAKNNDGVSQKHEFLELNLNLSIKEAELIVMVKKDIDMTLTSNITIENGSEEDVLVDGFELSDFKLAPKEVKENKE